MSNLKKALLLGVLGATAAASLAGYFLLNGPPARLAVDGALALVQLVIVLMMLAPTEKRVDLLVDALRALARGERHRRVNPDEFAGLAEVARAANEVAASLTENDDPNLGPVKSTPRKKEGASLPKPAAAPRADDDDPAVGPVRKLAERTKPKAAEPPPREPTKEPAAVPSSSAPAASSSGPPASSTSSSAPASTPPSATSATPSSAPSSAGSDAPSAARDAIDFSRPETAAPTNDTAVDEAKGSHASASASGVGEAEPPVFPTRAELEQLFSDFVAQKKAHDEAVADLDVDAFAQTILGECERLVTAHRCKGVKFEITEQDGEVSLRPRLLR